MSAITAGRPVTSYGPVKTWSDGFGRWYASVPGDSADPRRRAREAIRRELAARDELGSGARVRVERAPDYWHETEDTDARPVFREAVEPVSAPWLVLG